MAKLRDFVRTSLGVHEIHGSVAGQHVLFFIVAPVSEGHLLLGSISEILTFAAYPRSHSCCMFSFLDGDGGDTLETGEITI